MVDSDHDASWPGADREMPRYRCHKVVWALKIAELKYDGHGENGSAVITPVEQGYAPFPIDAAYVQKHKPQPGGYYVVYEDGYKSFSPGQAFVEGYARI